MITGIHHISMKCKNDTEYQKVKYFYTEILKLKIIKECDTCILLNTGAGIVEIFRDGKEISQKGIINHYAFAVDDTDTYAEMVRSAGYEVFVAPKNVLIGGDSAYPARIAFCKGPLGEEIEFFCQKW
ncbi:MAG: VOC family protein [Oscillospiraceae bacterium]|nr:VOC family protein [Oscillospiraceae bacterium]